MPDWVSIVHYESPYEERPGSTGCYAPRFSLKAWKISLPTTETGIPVLDGGQELMVVEECIDFRSTNCFIHVNEPGKDISYIHNRLEFVKDLHRMAQDYPLSLSVEDLNVRLSELEVKLSTTMDLDKRRVMDFQIMQIRKAIGSRKKD